MNSTTRVAVAVRLSAAIRHRLGDWSRTDDSKAAGAGMSRMLRQLRPWTKDQTSTGGWKSCNTAGSSTNVEITVADLDSVTAFFADLGLEVEGRTFVEGEFIDTVIGIPDSRTEIVMLRPPNGGTGGRARELRQARPRPRIVHRDRQRAGSAKCLFPGMELHRRAPAAGVTGIRSCSGTTSLSLQPDDHPGLP